MTATSAQLLKLALPLVKTHGFTREALARSVLSLPPSERSHTEPLSDSAVTALFGRGDQAKRTLIDAWMQDGLTHMAESAPPTGNVPSLKDALRARLKYNEDALPHLPAAYAILASNSNFHIVDPMPALKHASAVADSACAVAQDRSLQLDWYAKRASLAAIYAAAELHQLTSPRTAYSFLDSLFDTSASVKSSVDEFGCLPLKIPSLLGYQWVCTAAWTYAEVIKLHSIEMHFVVGADIALTWQHEPVLSSAMLENTSM